MAWTLLRPTAMSLLSLALLGADSSAPPPTVLRHGISAAERAFVDRHWARPIPPQGPAPERFSPLERSLAPKSCGTCHPAQLADWSGSLHARSMGPGMTGQLVEMARTDPETAWSCLSCHAPLAEQTPDVERGGRTVPNPVFDAALHAEGLVCAACHVRRHQRFGPPARAGHQAASGERLPHDGAIRTTAFQRSEFCTSCHQFPPDGFALNGKLLANTYQEWRASPAGTRGVQCQGCHMPDRRHLWRGIHDLDTVKSGLQITLETARPRHRPGERVQATLTITTPGVGHAFPTYVTPLVRVRAELVDAQRRPVPGSLEERLIGRQVPIDLSREIADTRIPAGGRFTLRYARRLDQAGLALRVTITVLPDEFYTRFFESLLRTGAGAGAGEIRQALEATRRSVFVIFDREVPLT